MPKELEKIIVDIPYKNLNKRVYFWGYKPMQLLVFSSIIAGAIIISLFFSIGLSRYIVLPIIVAPVIIVMGKVRKQNKNGVPDYASSMILYYFSPKYFYDGDFILKKLSENKLIDES